MIFKEKWNTIIILDKQMDRSYIERTYLPEWNQSGIRSQLALINKTIGLESLRVKNVSSFKKRMSYSAMTYEYCLKTHNIYWISLMIKPYAYALLSDNKNLIDLFANISLEPEGQKVPAHWNYGIQGLLREDANYVSKAIEWNTEKIEDKKQISISKAHMWCIQGIVNADKDLILKGLRQFELKVNKERFVENDICEEYISFFPIIYAKIAWLKGLEVDPQSKYMPLELLEVNPLEEYTIPYWFLRDYYREKGIDWRYDPIHPELQDWDNDPENPNRKGGGFFKKLFG